MFGKHSLFLLFVWLLFYVVTKHLRKLLHCNKFSPKYLFSGEKYFNHLTHYNYKFPSGHLKAARLYSCLWHVGAWWLLSPVLCLKRIINSTHYNQDKTQPYPQKYQLYSQLKLTKASSRTPCKNKFWHKFVVFQQTTPSVTFVWSSLIFPRKKNIPWKWWKQYLKSLQYLFYRFHNSEFLSLSDYEVILLLMVTKHFCQGSYKVSPFIVWIKFD